MMATETAVQIDGIDGIPCPDAECDKQTNGVYLETVEFWLNPARPACGVRCSTANPGHGAPAPEAFDHVLVRSIFDADDEYNAVDETAELYLQSPAAQELMSRICDGHEPHYDGHYLRQATLSDDAQCALNQLLDGLRGYGRRVTIQNATDWFYPVVREIEQMTAQELDEFEQNFDAKLAECQPDDDVILAGGEPLDILQNAITERRQEIAEETT